MQIPFLQNISRIEKMNGNLKDIQNIAGDSSSRVLGMRNDNAS
jgi:hypothetical protein